jgi:hypothetical protein
VGLVSDYVTTLQLLEFTEAQAEEEGAGEEEDEDSSKSKKAD